MTVKKVGNSDQYSDEEAELCRREGIVQNLYYRPPVRYRSYRR